MQSALPYVDYLTTFDYISAVVTNECVSANKLGGLGTMSRVALLGLLIGAERREDRKSNVLHFIMGNQSNISTLWLLKLVSPKENGCDFICSRKGARTHTTFITN